MTIRILTGSYAAGYRIQPGVNSLSVAASGYIGGAGLYATGSAACSVVNIGTITGQTPMASSVGTEDIYLHGGGAVTNGAPGHTTAMIEGGGAGVYFGGAGTVTNFATIQITRFTDDDVVELRHGGTVTNGANADRVALIGGGGVIGVNAPTTVANYGTIAGYPGSGDPAVGVYDGGRIVNGSSQDRTALLTGGVGVYANWVAATVVNFATIAATEDGGVYLGAGTLTNGGLADTTATISGPFTAVRLSGAGLIDNLGTLIGTDYGRHGAEVWQGALLNGSAADTVALIEGGSGVYATDGASIGNFGTILALQAAHDPGVYLDGARLTNGSAASLAAVVSGDDGVLDSMAGMAATVINFATIEGAGADGVYLIPGGAVTNGGAADAKARIAGAAYGVLLAGAGAVTNFGVIAGAGGVAVRFASAGDTLNVEAGASFTGVCLGDGGVLNLAGGTGALTGLFSAAGASVSGGMTPATFQAFDTVQVSAGAAFSDTDASTTIAAADRLSVAGNLTLSGAIANAGTIVSSSANGFRIAGALTNTGRLIAAAGTLVLAGVVTGTGVGQVNAGLLKTAAASTFNQNVLFAGGSTGTLELAHGQTYAGTISGFSLSGATALDLDDIGFTAATTTATYAGTTASGVLTVAGGGKVARIHFTGDYLASTWTLSSDGHGGTRIVDPAKAPVGESLSHGFVQAMAAVASRGFALPSPPMASGAIAQPLLAGPRQGYA